MKSIDHNAHSISQPIAAVRAALGGLTFALALLFGSTGTADALDFEPSCFDSCGGSADGCYCDQACTQYGDCCYDYEEACLTPETEADPVASVFAEFDTVLEPGVSHGFSLGAASQDRRFVVEVDPADPTVDGAHVESVLQREFDGETWNDVVRVGIPAGTPIVAATVRVYEVAGLVAVVDTDVVVEPGVTAGLGIGAAGEDRSYLVDVDPVGSSVNGAHIEAFVQQEFDGASWNDVVRYRTPAGGTAVAANMRVYEVSGLLEVIDTVAVLEPGVLHGFGLGPASQDRGYVIDVSPMEASDDGAHIEASVQQEFDGATWNDVLRVRVPEGTPSIGAAIVVYEITAAPTETPALASGVPTDPLGGASGEELRYSIDVPAGAPHLAIMMGGGGGDADLYVRYGAEPTQASWDCRPYKSGNSELCVFPAPSAGIWHVMVRGYSEFDGVTLTAGF